MNPSGGDGAGDGPFHNYGECLPSDFVRWGSVAYRQPSIPPNSRAIQGRSLFSMTGGSTPIPENPIFDVKELIGSGSYSNVYRAIDKRTASSFAIKCYRIKYRDAVYVTRAATEISFIRFLKHPNIIGYVLSDITNESVYLGIEYSPFGSLNTFIRQSPKFSEMAVQYVMSQLASAIVYLHSKWIFHGDVKPENIIVFGVEKNNRLRIKLTDFGLAEVIIRRNFTKRRAGSFYYMAPELHLGFPFDLTADLYSAGVLMYEMLIGTKPFAELTKDQYIVMLRKRMSIVMPQFDTSHLSAQCFGLLSSLLSYDKQNRLFGESLAKHPFINIEPIVDQQCHYSKACEFIVSGVTHVNNGQLGSGYIDVVEAALHLSIHINQQSDEILYHQLVEKLKEYIRYGDKVELRLLNDFSGSPLNIQTKDEKLRCLIKSTPQLLAAYDICSIGEMYLKQNSSKRGFELVRQGLEVLLPALGKEPDGPRKNLLAAKIDEWMKMLENVKREEEPAIA